MLLFPCNMDLLLVVPRLSSWARKIELGLDVGGSGLFGVALIRRREQTDRNRDSGVKIQIEDC